MKYQELFRQCCKIIEGFDNVNPLTDVVTIDEFIARSIDEYNSKILQEEERQKTLQAISTAGSPKQQGKKKLVTVVAEELPAEAWAAEAGSPQRYEGDGGDYGTSSYHNGTQVPHLATGTVGATKKKEQQAKPRVLNADETLFIQETVGGVFHHRPMVDQAFAGYRSGLSRNRSDYYPLITLTYLLIFRFHELGGPTLRLLIDRSASYAKLAEYLSFLTDADMLAQHVVPKWQTQYDDMYVEEVLVGAILTQKEDIDEGLRNWILEKGTNQKQKEEERQASLAELGKNLQSRKGASARGNNKSTIVAKAPNFTEKKESTVRKKEQLPPYEIREMMNLQPLPKLPKISDRCTTPEREAVAAAARGEKKSTLNPATREENRGKEKAIPFRSFSATNRPTNLPRLLEEAKERQNREVAPLALNRPSPEEVRARLTAINNNVDVKTTTAALRREELLYQKRQEEEELALKRLAGELHDDSSFQKWKKEGQMQDEIDRERHIAQRKIDMMMIDEAARETRRKQEKHNQAISRKMKKEADDVKKRNDKEEAKKLKFHQERAKDIKAAAEQSAKMKEVLAEQNRKIVLEQIEIKQQNELKVAMALELERERKQEMIKQIKETHAASVAMFKEQREKKRHVKAVDVGELVAMTYDELQDKLREVKAEHDDLVEKRRQEIIAKRDKEASSRQEMQERIFRERQRHLEKKAAERDVRRAEQAEKERRLKMEEDEKLLTLQSKLAEKREERARIERERKEEDRQRRLAAQLLSADADAVEKAKWDEMLRGQQNTILKAQNDRLVSNTVKRKREDGVVKLREKNIETAHMTRMDTIKAKDQDFTEKKQKFTADKDFDDSVRIEAYAKMKEEKKRRAELMLQHSRY